MLITISGPPGSGKSTAAASLAGHLGYDHVSGGDIFRSLAADRGVTLEEFIKLAEGDDSIDRDLDRRLRKTALDRDDLVLESRLAGWMAGEHADLKMWLDAPFEVRIDRIADREGRGSAEIREETAEREDSDKARYYEYYGIDFDDLRIYDLVLNTARWDENTVAALLVEAIEQYDPGTDEGAYPVDGVRYEF